MYCSCQWQYWRLERIVFLVGYLLAFIARECFKIPGMSKINSSVWSASNLR